MNLNSPPPIVLRDETPVVLEHGCLSLFGHASKLSVTSSARRRRRQANVTGVVCQASLLSNGLSLPATTCVKETLIQRLVNTVDAATGVNPTWSTEPFGNATACNWGESLLQGAHIEALHAAFDDVLVRGATQIEVCLVGVAALEVWAKLCGKGTQSDSFTEDLDGWAGRQSFLPAEHPSLQAKALQATRVILAPASPLRRHWATRQLTEWEASVRALRKTLLGRSGPAP